MTREEKFLLEKMAGQKEEMVCENCNNKVVVTIRKDGVVKCPNCNENFVLNLTEAVKHLKSMGETFRD